MHDAVMEARIQGRCLSAETLITKGQTSSLFASKLQVWEDLYY